MRNSNKNNSFDDSKVYDRLIQAVEGLQEKYPEYKFDSDFADLINVTKQSFSTYKNRVRKPNVKVIYAIKQVFPEVDLEYVFTGKGTIFLGETEEVKQLKQKIESLELKIEVYKEIIADK